MTPLLTLLNTELEKSGWNKRWGHFEAAVQALLNHDEETYQREMKAFREMGE